jgi:hypothetical protein
MRIAAILVSLAAGAVLLSAGASSCRSAEQAAALPGADLAINRAYAEANRDPEALARSARAMEARTHIEIRGDQFWINGRPTYEGRVWRGARIEGLLLNSRMVQGVFDDLNPETRSGWAYPDTGTWDPERNTREFVAAMPTWRDAGLLAVTVNLQGGNAHADNERWLNSAFGPDGSLHPAYFERLRLIVEEADRLGMAVILGLFYFRHDEALANEDAVIAAVDATVDWLHDVGARNILIEIDNECDIDTYDHAILRCPRVSELIERVQANERDGYRYPVSVSLAGGEIPSARLISQSDFILLHGNGVRAPSEIAEMAERVRGSRAWSPKPIVVNEDNHYGFEEDVNNFTTAVRSYVSWGYFDRRYPGNPMSHGFQTVPVDWTISSPRKRGFFALVSEITGANASR